MRTPNSLCLSFLFTAASLGLVCWSGCSTPARRITVAAGDSDRSQSLVRLEPRSSVAVRNGRQLRDQNGRLVPVQIDSKGSASFILDRLAKGQTAEFELTPAGGHHATASRDGVTVTRVGNKLKVVAAGKPVLEYQAEPGDLPRPDIKPIYSRGGYIHPVFSPSGLPVTDDYPANHVHHHGIWFPWTSTEFESRKPDFWNMGTSSGRVEFVAIDEFWSGPVQGGFRVRHRFVDLSAPAPKAALNETWEVTIHAANGGPKPSWIFDLVSTQECASASPLKLPKYLYGGLGFRGHWDWNGKDKTSFLTSEGETDRVKGNETRARWCHVGGLVNGQPTGIAILCHPDNFHAPQPMRLHPTEPFFCYAPSQLGEFQIEPGKPYVSRYRFVVMDGPPDRAEIDRLWNDYAHPTAVFLHGRAK